MVFVFRNILISSVIGATMMPLFAMGTTTSTAKSSQAGVAAEKQPAFSSSFSIAHSTNLYDFQDGSRSDGRSFNMSTSYRLSKFYSLSTSLGYEQDLKFPENDGLSDIPVTLKRGGLKLGSHLNGSLAGTLLLPASKMSKELNNLQAGARISGSLFSTPELLGNWTLGASLSLGQNFHQYDTNVAGSVLNQYVSNQTLMASYQNDKISLSIEFTHRNAVSYRGTLKESFDHTETLSFGITPALEVSIGHTNGGDIFKENGRDSNISLINENSSMVFAALGMGF